LSPLTTASLRLSIRGKQALRYYVPDSPEQLRLVPGSSPGSVDQDLRDRMARRFREEHGVLFQHSLAEPGVEDLFNQAASDLAIRWTDPPLAPAQRDEAVRQLVLRYLGYGPLDELLRDPAITEIMANRYDNIWIERLGRMIRTGVVFPSEEELFCTAQRMARRYGRELNRDHPAVDARLPDGSRIFAVTAPLNVYGTTLTIRRHPPEPYRGRDLIRCGMFTEEMLDFFTMLVRGKATVLVTGPMGTGKTTVIQVAFGDSRIEEHLVTIEDTDELRLGKCLPNVVAFQAQRRDEDQDNNGTNMYELAIKALRSNAQRILIGEIRAREVLAWRLAIESGHDGLWTSVHTRPGPDRAMGRVSNILAEAAHIEPAEAMRQVRDLVDMIVTVRRLPDGQRVVSQVTEVLSDCYNPVFRYSGARWERCGRLSPQLASLIEDSGVEVPPCWRS